MKYLSVCSGIEAASVACHSLGWRPIAFSEIEPFPCSVLEHHYPHVPNLGDMTKIDGSSYRGAVDLIVGGTPCQSFSVAGKRGGISDPRGALALAFVRLVHDVSPRWIIWENVPGVFSSGGGADFKAFAAALVDIGYHVAWRVLDAQYFGVPQRRRRVFLVGHFGDWRPAAAVLFESSSLFGNTATRRKKAKDIVGTLEASLGRSRGAGTPPSSTISSHFCGGPHPPLSQSHNTGGIGMSNQELFSQGGAGLILHRQVPEIEVTPINTQVGLCHNALGERTGLGIGEAGSPAYTLQSAHSHAVAIAFRDDATPKESTNGKALTLTTPSPTGGGHPQCVAFAQNQIGEVRTSDVFGTMNTNSNTSGGSTPLLQSDMHVRRLTPLECERLQGFPDHYTDVPHRGKRAADGNRYKALGNSMAVPVVKWLFKRIDAWGE